MGCLTNPQNSPHGVCTFRLNFHSRLLMSLARHFGIKMHSNFRLERTKPLRLSARIQVRTAEFEVHGIGAGSKSCAENTRRALPPSCLCNIIRGQRSIACYEGSMELRLGTYSGGSRGFRGRSTERLADSYEIVRNMLSWSIHFMTFRYFVYHRSKFSDALRFIVITTSIQFHR